MYILSDVLVMNGHGKRIACSLVEAAIFLVYPKKKKEALVFCILNWNKILKNGFQVNIEMLHFNGSLAGMSLKSHWFSLFQHEHSYIQVKYICLIHSGR